MRFGSGQLRGLVLAVATGALGLGLLLAPGPADAFVCKVSEQYGYVSLAWASRTLPYAVRSPGSTQLDADTVTRAVDYGFQAWTKPECTDLRFESHGVTDGSDRSLPQVAFIASGWTHAADAVGLTRTTYGVEDGVIRSAVIEVNEQNFKFRDVVADGCPASPPVYDLTSVVTHEVGHLIGLDHTRNYARLPTDPTMAPEVGPCETDKRTLEEDDIAGLCTLYPRGLPPGHCLPLPPAPGASYVSNTPFGCTDVTDAPAARRAPSAGLALLFVSLALFVRALGRGRARPAALSRGR